MPKMPVVIAIVLLSASSMPVFARGMQGGPIGPGSRDGLTPSASDARPGFFETERPVPVMKMRSKRMKRK